MFFSPPTTQQPKAILTFRILNLLSFICTIIINGIYSSNTGEISNQRQTWITPAGYAFSIWGLLYFLLAIFCIYQLFPATLNPCNLPNYSGSFELITNGVHVYFILSCIFNCLWIILWNQSEYAWPSLIVMSFLWITLAALYFSLDKVPKITDVLDSQALLPGSNNIQDKILAIPYLVVITPFKMYFAWITCATLVNIYAVFSTIDPNSPFDSINQSIVGIVLLGCIGLIVLIFKNDLVFAAVLIWALTAISKGRAITQYPGYDAKKISILSFGTASFLGFGFFIVLGIKIYKCYMTSKKIIETQNLSQNEGQNDILTGTD